MRHAPLRSREPAASAVGVTPGTWRLALLPPRAKSTYDQPAELRAEVHAHDPCAQAELRAHKFLSHSVEV